MKTQHVTTCGIATKAMFKGKFSTLNLYFRQEYFIKYYVKDNGSTEEKKIISSSHGVQFGNYFVEKVLFIKIVLSCVSSIG